MKRNPIKSIGEIRELCMNALSNLSSHDAKNLLTVLCRIEWICRHTEEDYDEKK